MERIKMERILGLVDASFAIVMTIMVLEVNWPHEASWQVIWETRHGLISYATSFLMIFTLWRSFNIDFARVKTVDNKSINGYGLVLFFASILPFATGYYVENIDTRIGASVYAISFMLLSISVYYFYYRVEKANPDDKEIYDDTEPDLRDLGMVFGTILGFIFVWFAPNLVLWIQLIIVLIFNISEETFPIVGMHLRELFADSKKTVKAKKSGKPGK